MPLTEGMKRAARRAMMNTTSESMQNVAGAAPQAKWRWNLVALNVASISFAILQSACTAVFLISGFRLAIGLSALAAAAGIHAPATGFHSDALRIPMMLLALAGAAINLYVVRRIRRLRNNPASQWRRRPLSKKKLNTERLQIGLAISTIALVCAEWITHPMVHRVP